MGKGTQFKELDLLDWKLHISFSPESAITRASRKLKINSEVGLYFDGQNTEINLFFENRKEMERDLNIFLRESDGFLENEIWRVRRSIVKRFEYVELIKSLLEIPSFVLISIWIRDGIFHTQFIFNSSQSNKASDIILGKLSTIEEGKLEYVGPNNGFAGILDEIDQRCELSIAQFELLPPKKEMEMPENPMGDHWYRILKKPYGTDPIRGVYIMSEKPSKAEVMTEVIKDSVYEATTDNAFLSYFVSEMHMKRIPTIAAFQKLDKPVFNLWIVFPSLFRNEILKIASDAREDLPNWHPSLKSLASFKEIFN